MLASNLRKLWGWRGLSACVFLTVTVISSVACQKSEAHEPGSAPVPQTTAVPPVIPSGSVNYVPLAWESTHSSERKNWSAYAFQLIDARFASFDQVRDMDIFCPNYAHLDRTRKINVWGMLVAEVAYYESGWDPTNRFEEPGMGADPVTGGRVFSEGLLQLSYQDERGRQSECAFNWMKDRNLPSRDPRKTILDPYINLRCGIGILADQIAGRRDIVLRSGEYWSTLRSYNSKVSQIAAAVKSRLKFCE